MDYVFGFGCLVVGGVVVIFEGYLVVVGLCECV